jgi:hypothetical protein
LTPPASARPWDVQTISSRGAAHSRGIDVLPSGQTALLVQHRVRAAARLELRIGRRTRVLDSGQAVNFEAKLDHDSHGRLVVAWLRFSRSAGPAQLFAWSAGTGRQQLAAGDNPATLALAVAPSGRAALAYWSPKGVFVSRAGAGRGFAKPESLDVTSNVAVRPGIGVTSGGRTVVAWSGRGGVLTRAANGASGFGPMQDVRLRAPAEGATLLSDSPKVVMTARGRAVVCVSSDELRSHRVVDSRVEAFDWPAGDAHPSGAATLSRGAGAGTADVVVQGASAAIAWTQRPKGSPRALWIARWTPRGLQRPSLYDTRALGLQVVLAPAASGALDAFYRAAGAHWFTVRLSRAGRFSGTSVVTPPSESISAIEVASAGRQVVAAWTGRERGPRVQLARPAR